MKIEPYLEFNGQCEAALEFYTQHIGITVNMLMRWSDMPPNEDCPPPEHPDQIMHACFSLGDTNVMVSDGRGEGQPSFAGISLSYAADTIADAERIFAALGDGGQVIMPLGKTFWSPAFGMLTDRFGLQWMVSVDAPPAES